MLLETATTAFERNWTGLKLYFMLGLPSETMEDIEGIINLVDKVRTLSRKTRKRTPQIRVNVSTFVPKPHTPFQWVAQANETELSAKHELLKQGLRRKGIKLSWQDPEVSLLEATLSRGDRRLGKVIFRAWQLGCTFDSWDEHFNNEHWSAAFERTGIDPGFYGRRDILLTEVLPWSHIKCFRKTDFLLEEHRKMMVSLESPPGGQGRKSADKF